VRITLTNLFQDKYRKAGNNLSLPVPIKHAGKWICCCVDVGAILKRRGYLKEHPGFRKGLAKKMKKSMKRPFYLKHFKICSNLKARGIFTSDNLYDPNVSFVFCMWWMFFRSICRSRCSLGSRRGR
jgi:hypothetical protein